MLMNCAKCKNLNINYVNTASGLDLHRFNWLQSEEEIGEIKGSWNSLVESPQDVEIDKASLIHWTLGGPWFKEQRNIQNKLSSKWFKG